MPPNQTQDQNVSPASYGNDPQPRKSGSHGRRKKTSCQRMHHSGSGYAGDSSQQNPQRSIFPPGQEIAALTAHAYNSYKQTFRAQEASGCFEASHRSAVDNTMDNSMLRDSAGQNCGVNSSGNVAYQPYSQYSHFNSSNPSDLAEYPQQPAQNTNSFNRPNRWNQGGNAPPARGQVMWSQNNQSAQQYSQTKVFDDWNEEQQFRMGGNPANMNYLNQSLMGEEQNSWSQNQNKTNEQQSSSCLTNPVELAMQVQPKARFRAGGGGSCCPRQESRNGCQGCDNGQQQQGQKSCCPGFNDQQALPANGGFAGGSNFGGFPECIDPSQAGVESFQPEPSSSGIEAPPRAASSSVQQQASSSSKTNKSSRFEFTSPDSLRTKLQEYIHNRPMGPTPVGKLKPFLGAREDALSCRTCYTPADENTLPAACQPCGRLEMTAQDFENEELAAKKKVDDAKALAEREKTMAEVACYKSIMPMDFTCTEQLQYMQCMGASKKAIRAFRDMQREEGGRRNSNLPGQDNNYLPTGCGACQSEGSAANLPTGSQPMNAMSGSANNVVKEEFLQELQNVQNTPLPDPNYRKKVLSRQVMPASQRRRSANPDGSPIMSDLITPITEENEQSQSGKSSSATTPDELQKLLQQCRDELGAVDPNMIKNSFTQNGNVEDIVEQDVQLYKMLSGSQDDETTKRVYSDECDMPPHSGDGDQPKKVVQPEEDETAYERAKLLRQYPMFGPQSKEPERGLKETMLLYKEHLANIRRRYFGEVVKHMDEVEDITPEIAAAMVFSEEEGHTMIDAPEKIYDYLYPESPTQPLVTIADVTRNLPPGYDDIVVPLIPPMQLTSADFPGLEDPAMLDSPRVIQIGPALNLADEPMITETKAPTDIAELVTGLAETMTFEVEDEDEEGEGISEDIFNFKLPITMPPHYSKMQMRGSAAPNWFPGYYLALQTKAGVNVFNSHGSILEKVWEDVQPDAVRPAAGAVVIGE